MFIFLARSALETGSNSLILPVVNTEAMSLFLEEVRSRHPGEYILMFMDQAGWHTASRLKPPENMELAFLPPYSPELNPQEQIWDELREKHLRNRLVDSLEAVIDAAADGLRALERQTAKIKSLTHRA